MRIGIILRGITVGSAFNGPRDWNLTKDNIKENIIDSFREKCDVNVYITTYTGSPVDDIVKFYQPKRMNLLPLQGSNQRLTVRQSCLDVENEDVDFFFITRFDIEFLQKFGNLNYDFNKFNVMYKEIEPNWSQRKFVSDIMFGFPKKYLIDFIRAVDMEEAEPSRSYVDLHNIYNRMCGLIGVENIHFVHNEPHPEVHTCTPENPAGNNYFYRIIRNK